MPHYTRDFEGAVAALRAFYDAARGPDPLRALEEAARDVEHLLQGREGRGTDRPPLGPLPRPIWLEHRALELMRAIADAAGVAKEDSDFDRVATWTDELADVFREIPHAQSRWSEDLARRRAA